jgi:predicted enzyme related to lactoylglutathione lyase
MCLALAFDETSTMKRPSGKQEEPMTRRSAIGAIGLSVAAFAGVGSTGRRLERAPALGGSGRDTQGEETMEVYYLEIVSTDPDATCELYSQMHAVSFGEPDPSLGGARTARFASGRLIGVRASMNDTERSLARPYFLVEDIEAAVAAAESAGAEITVPPMPIPGHGTCAIIYHSGVESGLWQV